MEERIICTIITGDFAHYALALHDSLASQDSEINFAIFISGGKISEEHLNVLQKKEKLKILHFSQLEKFGLAKELNEKYANSYHDAFRWGMKPVFTNFLLSEGYEKVIYLDSDLFFFGNYEFLFEELDRCSVLLSPHWRSSNPKLEYSNFVDNFRDGIYNAGFFGASKGARKALDWWSQMVLFKCEVSRKDGYYVDQRYLDILPVYFRNIKHLEHRGCNVGNWNQTECKRGLNEHGEVLINEKFPIVFIHFTNSLLRGVLLGGDKLLMPHLEEYRKSLLKYSRKDIIEEFYSHGQFEKPRSERNGHKEVQNKTSITNKIRRRVIGFGKKFMR